MVRRRTLAVLVCATLVACAARAPRTSAAVVAAPAVAASEVAGSRADVRTSAGAYDGFTVIADCRERDCFGVHGLGAQHFPGLRPWDRPLAHDDAEAWRGVVMGALAAIPSVHLSGYGSACNQPGLFVWLDDWRDVDRALARLGAMLRAGDLDETIGVCVQGRVHPEEVGRRR